MYGWFILFNGLILRKTSFLSPSYFLGKEAFASQIKSIVGNGNLAAHFLELPV